MRVTPESLPRETEHDGDAASMRTGREAMTTKERERPVQKRSGCSTSAGTTPEDLQGADAGGSSATEMERSVGEQFARGRRVRDGRRGGRR